ncbi:MAG: amino acid adenylation domain-containing protein, partial [Acidobacteriota bacterium]|nr:amino acid adenylation domain-containing protein [Acidobacteriota bacterium]
MLIEQLSPGDAAPDEPELPAGSGGGDAGTVADGAGEPSDGEELFVTPASSAQRRLWLVDRLEPGTSAYNVPIALVLCGPFDRELLARALQEAALRHESLRTTFGLEDERPVQMISPESRLRLEWVDLSGCSEGPEGSEGSEGSGAAGGSEGSAAAAAEAARRMEAEARQPFDLERGPLLRATLYRLAPEEYRLLMTVHHIVTDAWSVGVLLRDYWEIYAALRAGRPPRLPELPIQYADFAAWQEQVLQGDTLERKLAYWRRQLAGAPATLSLPFDRPRPATRNRGGGVVDSTWGEVLVRGIQATCRDSGATLFMVLLAAWQTVLQRYSGQDDIVVGSPVANRGRVETENVVGFFINNLVLRTDLGNDPPFGEVIARVRQVTIEAYAHEDLPFERLVEELQPERQLNQNPLFQVALSMNSANGAQAGPAGGLAVRMMEVHTGTAKFDLSLEVASNPDAAREAGREAAPLNAGIEYSSDLFDPTTVARLARHLETLMADAVAHPERRISALAMLSDHERHQLTHEVNDSSASYPREASIQQLFEEQARLRPQAVAVADGGATLTYGELEEAANRLTRRLRGLGIEPETRAAIALERGLAMVVAVVAVVKAGGTYLPLDAAQPAERLAFMLHDAAALALITCRSLLPRLPVLGIPVLCLDERGGVVESGPDPGGPGAPGAAGGAGGPEEPPEGAEPGSRERQGRCRTTPLSLAYVAYTSGSTGTPKGVAVPHRAVSRLVLGTDYVALGPGSTVAQAANASFDAATFEIWGALLKGGRLAVVRREVAEEPQVFAREIRERRIDTLFLTTALFNQLAGAAPGMFQPLAQLLVGGEAADPARLAEVLAAGAPGTFLNVYGPTESTTFASWQPLREVPAGMVTVPIGRPIANTTIHLLDRSGNLVPLGVAGEIAIGGDGLARGYLGRPALTAERFVPDPLAAEPGGRLYRTGDLGRRRPGGEIEFLGRLDRQVKIRGFRIEPAEIEA